MSPCLFPMIEVEIDPATLPGETKYVNELTRHQRGELVLAAADVIKAEAVNHAKGIGRTSEIDDFIGVAQLATVEAAIHWNPVVGVKFTTYATSYIRRQLARETANLDQARDMAEGWDAVPQKDVDEGDREASGPRVPTPEQMLIIGQLPASNREIVRLSVFELLTPETIAIRLGLEVKDVKLAIRNAAQTIQKFLAHDDSPENLFGDIYEEPADEWPPDDHAC